MKKILCFLFVLSLLLFTLSAEGQMEISSLPVDEDAVIINPHAGMWVVSEDSLIDWMKEELLREGLSPDDELYQSTLNEGIDYMRGQVNSRAVILNEDNTGYYSNSEENYNNFTYEIKNENELYLTRDDQTKLYGVFNDDYSRLYINGIDKVYLIREKR